MLLFLMTSWMLVIIGFLETVQCVQTRHYEFNLTMDTLNPDCSHYTSLDTLFINGQMPGPTITALKGDRLLVHFQNQLPSNQTDLNSNTATLHFHGIRQTGTPQADGVPFLTQDPVKPGGGHYLYDFYVGDQAGTFFYHAHVGLQDFYGPLIVYESEDADPSLKKQHQKRLLLGSGNRNISFDDERTVILGEWHHRNRSDLERYIIGPDYAGIPDADSLLINGKAIFNNSRTSGFCEGYHQIPVEQNRTYRLRVIGATTYRTLGFAVAHHRLTIIEVDGYLVTPYETNYLEVAPGQRFSVLLKTDQPAKDYSIGITRRYVTIKALQSSLLSSNGWAILHYQRGDKNKQKPQYTLPMDQPNFPREDISQWIWTDLKPLNTNKQQQDILKKKPSRTILLNTTNRKELRGGELVQRFYTNNHTYDAPGSTLLHQILNGTRTQSRYTISQLMEPNGTHLPGHGYDPDLGTYPLEHMEIVDFVIQNTYMPGLPCHQHPWHSHGHSHWMIAYGPGSYNESKHGLIRNVPTPVLKDTTTIYPMMPTSSDTDKDNKTMILGTERKACGWSKIRIIADNPGIWALHCHIAPHMLQGMMVVLEESPELVRSHSHLVKLVHHSF